MVVCKDSITQSTASSAAWRTTKSVDKKLARAQVEQDYEYNKWDKCMPSLHFKKKWKVYIRPPFGGAIVRFTVKYKKKEVSCYLDCYNELGWYGEPYWEIYPYADDVFRCPMNDTETLMKKIEEVLEE